MHPSLRCRAVASFWVNILLSGDLFNFNLSSFFSGELNVVVPLRGHVNRVGVVREGGCRRWSGKGPCLCIDMGVVSLPHSPGSLITCAPASYQLIYLQFIYHQLVVSATVDHLIPVLALASQAFTPRSCPATSTLSSSARRVTLL